MGAHMNLVPGYREFAPPAAVAPLIECVWTRAGGDEGIRIMPDGASDVIWRRVAAPSSWGPTRPRGRTSPRRLTCSSGLRFRPGAGGAAIGVPLDELRDLQVHARDIDRAFDLDGDLPPATVVARLLRATAGRRPDPIVMATAPRVADRQVAVLARELSISERQLRRRFHAAVGYGAGHARAGAALPSLPRAARSGAATTWRDWPLRPATPTSPTLRARAGAWRA